MKKFVLSIAALASIVALAFAFGCVFSPNTASAQNPPPAPTKVGLIDMAYVFKNYEKFKAMRDALKEDIQASDQQAKTLANQIKTAQEQLKQWKEGSPEFLEKEKELTGLASDFETFRKNAQRDFLRKEADIYKTVYMEVADAVKLYANHYSYGVILRFNRESVNDATNPQEVLQSMNRQVVHFNAKDDITDSVLQYLNKRYTPQAGGAGTGTSRN